MLGAQRHIEARIGQLLGQAKEGGDKSQITIIVMTVVLLIPNDQDRFNFCLLGRRIKQ